MINKLFAPKQEPNVSEESAFSEIIPDELKKPSLESLIRSNALFNIIPPVAPIAPSVLGKNLISITNDELDEVLVLRAKYLAELDEYTKQLENNNDIMNNDWLTVRDMLKFENQTNDLPPYAEEAVFNAAQNIVIYSNGREINQNFLLCLMVAYREVADTVCGLYKIKDE